MRTEKTRDAALNIDASKMTVDEINFEDCAKPKPWPEFQVRMSFSTPMNAMLRFLFPLGVSLALASNCPAESPRQHLRIDDNWKFFLGDPKNAPTPDFADSEWRSVTLPHDWSIEGNMDPKAPMGGQGGFFPAGIGWYRYHWQAPADWKGKCVRVEFEGVYMNADVYLNGQKLDSHPYGFTSFFVDLTPALKAGDGNVLAVRVDNSAQKKTVDEVTTRFGVRALAWTADKGLTLNGKTYKLAGGCIHDDNGVLGACAFDRAEERKVELLKAAGFTALRTAHNPPSPALLDACDRLGMLVLDEAFDCWIRGKNTFDYHLYFKDWWQRDIDSFVQRDRNHPAVVMWSIGNEIPGVYDAMGNEYSPKLVNEIHALDITRPVTNGVLGWPPGMQEPQNPGSNSPAVMSTVSAGADAARTQDPASWTSLDIVGSNYHIAGCIARHVVWPDRVLVSTESNPPLGEANHVLDNTFVVGDFVWSAQDYLGEVGIGRWFYEGDPTEPLTTQKNLPPTKLVPVHHGGDALYPWRGSDCGDLDLIGNSKPAAHHWNIVWNRGEKLYLAVRQPEDDKKITVVPWGWYPAWENWTWPGREGKAMSVEVYSRYPSVRLYLNDKLVGEMPTTLREGYQATFKLTYQPGILKAVGVEDGKEGETMQLETAGDPASIKLSADRITISADGQDLSFIQVDVLDKQGRLQPNVDELISFTLTGPGTIAGLGNAWLKSTEPFQGTTCHVYQGRALIVLRGSKTAGTLALKADSPGLASASVAISCQ